MSIRPIPNCAQRLVIITTNGPKLLVINGHIVMTCDHIFRKDIHPQQINPWMSHHEGLKKDVMVIHPAALIKMIIKLENNDAVISYIDTIYFTPMQKGKAQYSDLNVLEKDIIEAVHLIK